jgi:[acyl-carrier-protein] S-malonyltransferase
MKIALVFPGYGSQFVGMGKELYDEYRIVQEYFEEASNCSSINFVKLCFASSDSEISTLVHAYSSLFVIGGAVFALLKENGITPDVVMGFNNGETTALFAAGCFSLPDGLYLINKMCSFFQEAIDTMDVEVMHVIGRSAQELEEDFSGINHDARQLFIAFYNSPFDHIVVGSRGHVGQLRDILESNNGIKIDYLTPEVGFHSEMMNGVIDQFKIYLEKVDFKDLTIPMISGLDGALVTKGEQVKERFIRHMNEPVNFELVIRALADYDMIIVATPAEQLGKMLKKQYPEKTIVTIDKKADIEAFKELVQSGI